MQQRYSSDYLAILLGSVHGLKFVGMRRFSSEVILLCRTLEIAAQGFCGSLLLLCVLSTMASGFTSFSEEKFQRARQAGAWEHLRVVGDSNKRLRLDLEMAGMAMVSARCGCEYIC